MRRSVVGLVAASVFVALAWVAGPVAAAVEDPCANPTIDARPNHVEGRVTRITGTDRADVIVGTPGRVIDLMNQGFLSMPWAEFAVLDEADKMLEIGFVDDVRKILEATGEYRQTMLFSATFPPALLKLARDYTTNPFEVATASGVATVDTIDQNYIEVTDADRPRVLRDLVRRSGKDGVFLCFCDRRTDVDKLMRQMERERFAVKALHGGYDQAARFKVMTAFRTGDVKALVATVGVQGQDCLFGEAH